MTDWSRWQYWQYKAAQNYSFAIYLDTILINQEIQRHWCSASGLHSKMENRRSSILLEHSIYHLNSDERLRESRFLPFTQPFNRIQVADARARDTTCVARTLPEICWKPVLKLAQVLARRGHVHVDVTQRLVDNKPLEGVGYPPSSTLLWHIPVTHTPIPYRPTCSIPSPACQPRESRRRSSWKGTSETKILGKKCRQGEQNVVKYGYFQGEHG